MSSEQYALYLCKLLRFLLTRRKYETFLWLHYWGGRYLHTINSYKIDIASVN